MNQPNGNPSRVTGVTVAAAAAETPSTYVCTCGAVNRQGQPCWKGC